jgi:peptide/nickel transport system substrate-binding protein
MGKDVDFIDYVPPTQAEMLKKREGINVFARASDRIIYLFINVEADDLPAFTDAGGKPLGKNPLRDKNVRKAIAMSIDRQVIVKKVMKDLALAETQTIPKGWYGYNPDIKNPPYDPDQARKLLAEAGYPEGFGLTVYGPNDRYVNDSQICQAVGQMMSRIGLKVRVDTMPKSVFFSKVGPPNNQWSFGLLGWGNTPVSTDSLEGLIHSNAEAVKMGQYNAGGYARPEVDALIEKAAMTVDFEAREKLIQQASALAMEDVCMIPLHTQFSISAGRPGLEYTPRADEGTLAVNIKAAR